MFRFVGVGVRATLLQSDPFIPSVVMEGVVSSAFSALPPSVCVLAGVTLTIPHMDSSSSAVSPQRLWSFAATVVSKVPLVAITLDGAATLAAPPYSPIEAPLDPFRLVEAPPWCRELTPVKDRSDTTCLGCLLGWQNAWLKEMWTCRVVSISLAWP